MVRHRALLLASLTLALAVPVGRALGADAPPPAAPLPADHAAAEAKALLALLRSAVKEDFRRQAWWLATRLLAVQPGQKEAEDALARWKGEDLALGRPPSKAWEQQRDAALAKVGDAWAQHAKDETAAGADPATTLPAIERALAYGWRPPDVREALAKAGRVWAGTWGSLPRADVEKALGDRTDAVVWEAERDDDVLEVRALWPQARVARIGDWRLFSTGDLDAVGQVLVLLAAQEQDFVVRFGSHAKPPKDPDEDAATDLVLVPDAETYDRLAPILFPQGRGRGQTPQWEGASGYYGAWRRRLLVIAKDRDNPWTPADANLLAWAARGLVKRHLAPDASGWLSGRGAWLVDGVAALYAGFGRREGAWDLDPARSWYLAAARAAKERWIPWARLVEMDRAAVDAEGRVDVEMEFGGAKQKAVKVDLVLAQATAFAAGVARSDPKKGWARLAALVEETYKRDRLPDLDKALGGKAKAVFAAAEEAADAATGG